MRASDYIGISEGIRSREIKLQNELSEINGKISSLQNTLDSLESELDILEMELDAALSDTDEDGNVDMRRVGAIRARMSAVSSRIGGCQSELSEQENEKQKIENELQTVETEKQQTLSQIQSAANVKNQNLSRLSGGLNGDYASIGQNLQSAFQMSLGQLSQAASILGGSISVATNGGIGGGDASGAPTASKASGNTAMVGGIGSRGSSTIPTVSTGDSTRSAPTDISLVTPSASHNSPQSSLQTESQHVPLHKNGGEGQNTEFLSKINIMPLSSAESISANKGSAADLTSQGEASSSPHTFKDYLNPANYDSNGHYTGDYRSPAIQSQHAVNDYNIWESNGGMSLPSTNENFQLNIVAQNIFGIRDSESSDFWNYKSRPQKDYIAMATYIPLVKHYLDSGIYIDDIVKMGGTIGACATNYFKTPIPVMKCGNAYILCDGGRHRVLAAQIAKVEIPVTVVREFQPVTYFKELSFASRLNSSINSQAYVSTLNNLRSSEVTYNPIKPCKIHRSNAEIIMRISGGDMTEGSCSSLAFTYAGNIAGYDVLDFRDGQSRRYFSMDSSIELIASLSNVNSKVVKGKDDFHCVHELLGLVQENNEYYLSAGQHAAIIRRYKGSFEYLELQHPNPAYNGWHKLNDNILMRRFGCERTNSFECTNVLIDVKSLTQSGEFLDILGYINTDKSKQHKGEIGSVK